jgi:hypothetical protein
MWYTEFGQDWRKFKIDYLWQKAIFSTLKTVIRKNKHSSRTQRLRVISYTGFGLNRRNLKNWPLITKTRFATKKTGLRRKQNLYSNSAPSIDMVNRFWHKSEQLQKSADYEGNRFLNHINRFPVKLNPRFGICILGCVLHRVWPGSAIKKFSVWRSMVKYRCRLQFGTGKVRDLQCFERMKRTPGVHGFWSFMARSNRPLTPNNISKNQIRRQRGSEVMDTKKRENRPTFASRRSRPRSGWANGTLKLLLAPDCPDQTVSE